MRQVVLIAFDGVQMLDLSGPMQAFDGARRQGADAYGLTLASTAGGLRQAICGLRFETRALETLDPAGIDTLLVAGGDEAGIGAAMADTTLHDWLRAAVPHCRRWGSVCSGAFVLAAAGLIASQKIATHWLGCARLAGLLPEATLEADAIFVRDGRLWTSAGVTTGIDMALAMVEEDHGRAVADAIARRLVLLARRPGHQAQLSEQLKAQQASAGRLAEIIDWLRAHPGAPGDVAVLAARAGMSERSFHRHCVKVLGLTPAKLVEKLRLEAARSLLAQPGASTKAVAAAAGFGDAARMSRAFTRALGVAPTAYRRLASARAPFS